MAPASQGKEGRTITNHKDSTSLGSNHPVGRDATAATRKEKSKQKETCPKMTNNKDTGIFVYTQRCPSKATNKAFKARAEDILLHHQQSPIATASFLKMWRVAATAYPSNLTPIADVYQNKSNSIHFSCKLPPVEWLKFVFLSICQVTQVVLSKKKER